MNRTTTNPLIASWLVDPAGWSRVVSKYFEGLTSRAESLYSQVASTVNQEALGSRTALVSPLSYFSNELRVSGVSLDRFSGNASLASYPEAIDLIQASNALVARSDLTLLPADSTYYESFDQKLLEAISIIRISDLDLWKELSSSLKNAVLFESETVQNFSDPKLFGYVFIRAPFPSDSVNIAVDLVHEAAHHAFFVATSLFSYSPAYQFQLFSPLRKTNRPLIGVLHGAVALFRMLSFVRKLDAPLRSKLSWENQPKQLAELLQRTLDEIDRAPLSEEGKDLFRMLSGEQPAVTFAGL